MPDADPVEPTRQFAPPAGTAVFAPPGEEATCTSSDAAPPAAPPTAVPGFELIRELGRGGMGVVYLARQRKLNREVALKMVLGGGHASAAAVQRFLAEAESAAAVQHPNVAQVYELGQHDGLPYFALEFCPGGALAAKLNGTPLPAREAARLAEQLARAVHAAHDKGIVHRDLKPQNVLLAIDGTPKVTDFGLARRLDSDSGLTATGAVLGSPSYMAPEQAAGQLKLVGPRSDVYGLGAMLYEFLTGRPPFRAATAVETVRQVINQDPLPPRAVNPAVPRDLETVCLKCLHKDPARRYGSARELADDLGRFLAGQPITARPVPAWERGWKAVRRHPALAATGAVTLLAAAAVVAVVLLANARLQRERDAAQADRDRALAAERDADEQRRKAHDRLQFAVDAVDRMTARVAGEKWSSRPELVEERRRVLEDVVDFYRRLSAEDGRDPLVRREKARALYRIATAYFVLAEYALCDQAAREAAELQEGLAAEFPNRPEHRHDLAVSLTFVGHVALLTAKFDQGVAAYERALAAARQAADARPDSDEFRLTLAECLSDLGRVRFGGDFDKAAGYFREAQAIVEPLAARPAAPFAARLGLAGNLLDRAELEVRRGRPQSAAPLVLKADVLVMGLSEERPPTPQLAEVFDHDRARVAYLDGVSRIRDRLWIALTLIDRLLTSHPRSFPLQFMKFQALAALAPRLDQRDDRPRVAQIDAELAAVQAAILRDAPQMAWVRPVAAGPRAMLLVYRARGEEPDGLDRRASELLTAAPWNQQLKYNVACAYAQASRHATADKKERYAARAVALLSELSAAGYFRDPRQIVHLDGDPDLRPLGRRADYARFRAPFGPEVAPPPRPVRRPVK